MKKWFNELTNKTKIIILSTCWILAFVMMIIIGTSPTSSDNLTSLEYFEVVLFIVAIVFGVIFSVWFAKNKKTNIEAPKEIQKEIEHKLESNSIKQTKKAIYDNNYMFPSELNLTIVDLETPNRSNDKICSIAIVNYNNGEIKYKANLLVNPEARFDNVNMGIHGITPQMVKDAPTLPLVWDKISKYFINSIIVGHGVNFDLNVLDKALNFYGLKLNSLSYIDTLSLAKKYVEASSYKLSELCKELGCCVQSHDALSDCYDCKNLLQHIINNNNINLIKETEEYYIQHKQAEVKGYKVKSSKETLAFNRIQSLVERITEDNQISQEEINKFIQLVEDNKLTDTYPISKAYQIAKNKTGNISEVMAEVKGDIKADKFDKVFSGKIFCLTGDFNHGSKEDITKYIESKGGSVKDSLTLKVDYLVRGLQGSEVYAYGSYGGKVKKALEMKEKGSSIKIISENDLY